MKFLRSTTTLPSSLLLPLLLLLSSAQQHVTALDLPKYTDMDTAKLFVGSFNRETKGVSCVCLPCPALQLPAPIKFLQARSKMHSTHTHTNRREKLIGVSGASRANVDVRPRHAAVPVQLRAHREPARLRQGPARATQAAQRGHALLQPQSGTFPSLLLSSLLPPPSLSPCVSLHLPAFLPPFLLVPLHSLSPSFYLLSRLGTRKTGAIEVPVELGERR